MAAAAIWKIEKSQYICYGWTSFEKIWHGDVPRSSRPHQHIKFMLLKIQHGRQLPSGKYKKHDISKIICTYFCRILVC